MNRIIAFCLFGGIMITLLGPLQSLLRMETVVIDLPLIIILHLSMATRPGSGVVRTYPSGSSIDWTGGVVGLTVGYVMDVMSAGVKGIHCLTLVVVFLTVQRAARNVHLVGWLPVFGVTLITSLAASSFALTLRWVDGTTATAGTVATVVAQALLTALAAPLVLCVCRYIDARILGAPAERGLS